MTLLVQVPESLADELCESNGWRVALAARSGTLDVALQVLATGSNVVSLIGAPVILRGTLETIRSWLRIHSEETTVEVHGPSIDTRIVIRSQADIEKAIALVVTSLSQVQAN